MTGPLSNRTGNGGSKVVGLTDASLKEVSPRPVNIHIFDVSLGGPGSERQSGSDQAPRILRSERVRIRTAALDTQASQFTRRAGAPHTSQSDPKRGLRYRKGGGEARCVGASSLSGKAPIVRSRPGNPARPRAGADRQDPVARRSCRASGRSRGREDGKISDRFGLRGVAQGWPRRARRLVA